MRMKLLRIIAGFLLAAAGAAGVCHACRVSAAQALYFRAKYGADAADGDKVLALCSMAHAFYPHNYYCALLAGQRAWDMRSGCSSDEERAVLTALAAHWCDVGLALNPYQLDLRYLRMRILEAFSIQEAIAYWQRHVEWQFWAPYNHLVLVELHSKAGDFEKAVEAMKWVRGTEYEREASARLREAWEKESSFPAGTDRRPAPAPR